MAMQSPRSRTAKSVRQNRCAKYAVCFRVLVIVLVSIGVALQVLAGLTCEFVTSHAVNGPASEGTLGLVYWSGVDANATTNAATECVPYPYFESYWMTAARTGLYLAVVATGALALILVVELLLMRVCGSSTLIVAAFLLSLAGSGATFALFGSPFCKDNRQCSLGQGSNIMVVALTTVLIAALLVSCTPKPDPLLQQWQRRQHAQQNRHDRDLEKESPSILTDLSGGSESFNRGRHTSLSVSTEVEDVK